MAVPVVYRKSQEQIISSYNYSDVAEGTGIIAFYGTKAELSGSTIYPLSQNAMGASGYPYMVNADDWNFEISPFNLPKVIGGTLYVAGEFYGAATSRLAIDFYKVSNGTATYLCSANSASVAANSKTLFSVSFPQTNFAKGDIFRARVLYTSATSGFNIDPTSATLQPFRIYIPFKIDL